MTAKTPPSKELADKVLIYHTGASHGPLDTSAGRLAPGQSLAVPAALAEKLLQAYPHIKRASDLLGGGPKAAALAADEKAKLEATIEQLKKDGTAAIEKAEQGEKAALEKVAELEKAAAEAVPADVSALHGVIREFLAAGSKKDLEALQEKHKDSVPAAPAA